MKNDYIYDLYLIAKELEKINIQLEARYHAILNLKKAA